MTSYTVSVRSPVFNETFFYGPFDFLYQAEAFAEEESTGRDSLEFAIIPMEQVNRHVCHNDNFVRGANMGA